MADRTPPADRPGGANLALVPGSLFATRALWRQVAASLPPGIMLVVVPERDGPQRQALETVALVLRAQGHPVTTLPASTVQVARGIQGAFPLPSLPAPHTRAFG
jgi:hypothetical protein